MISIVIPTYNAEKFMPALLDSIFSSTVSDFEVIIVDDCSTDNTVEAVKKYPVKLIRLTENSGPGKARNMGVKTAHGDIIFFLDSDVTVTAGTIEEAADFFKSSPSVNCVIGVCEKEPLNSGFVPRYMALFEYVHLKGSRYDEVSVFAPRCGAIKKNLFEKIGGYNETYKGADVEDFELARRINRTDRIILNRRMVVKHQFANFRQAVKNYFKRAFMWVRLFIKEKRFDNAGPSVPSNGIAALSAFSALLSLVLTPFLDVMMYFFVFFMVVYLLANLKWLSFMYKEAGFAFTIKALFLNFFLGIDIVTAAM
ncbi:MAG TPA: glycosyltransferase family 2 protein, partial [Nitrospirae bacterium]|nr:glycosyltransferase family 2 protein [Nitrospirota bacterium]